LTPWAFSGQAVRGPKPCRHIGPDAVDSTAAALACQAESGPIASGGVLLGNIGTYQLMDFTAVGGPVNLASRLMRTADTTAPCISHEMRALLRDRFVFAASNPRTVELPEIGRREVWDVVGRKERPG
jgi:class 3 adenylate cyclase